MLNSAHIANGSFSTPVVPFFLYLGFSAFFLPAEYAIPGFLYGIWRYALIAVGGFSFVAVLCLKGSRTRWVSWLAFFFSLFLLPIVFSGGFYEDFAAEVKSALYLFMKAVGFVSFLEYSFTKCGQRALEAFTRVGLFFCLLHIASFLVFGDVVGGMRSGWIESDVGETRPTTQNWYFLTYDNASIFYFVPTFCALVYRARKGGLLAKGMTVAFAFATLYMYGYKSSVTAFIVFLLTVIGCVVALRGEKGRGRARVLTYRHAVIVGLAFCVIVLAASDEGPFSAFSFLAGKGGDLSGRGEIWARSLELIPSSPLFGLGIMPGRIAYLLIGQTHCHNLVLQIVFTGGLVSLGCFVAAVRNADPQGQTAKTGDALSDGRIWTVAITAILLASAIDWSYNNHIYLVVFYLASCCSSGLEGKREGGI